MANQQDEHGKKEKGATQTRFRSREEGSFDLGYCFLSLSPPARKPIDKDFGNGGG